MKQNGTELNGVGRNELEQNGMEWKETGQDGMKNGTEWNKGV